MKHVRQKPTFGGTITGATLNNSATPVTGLLTIAVKHGDQDEAFRPGVFKTQYGTMTVTRDGHWSYVLDTANATVTALATSATLVDNVTVAAKYAFRGLKGPVVAITITGH
jgi:VCBS repeat-containing protein